MNQAEFINIVMPFKDKIFRLAKRLLISTEEAEDATQEVLLKLWKNKEQMQNYRNVEAFSLNDSISWVGKIIENLPEQQKMVIQLRDIEQYDLDEIAQMLEMKNTAVRVTLSRARKAIREQLTNTHSYGVK